MHFPSLKNSVQQAPEFEVTFLKL